MLKKNDNAAARLHTLLSRLRISPPQGAVAHALRAILVLGSDEDNLVLQERFGRIFALNKRASSAAKTLSDHSSDLFIQWIPKVEQSLFALSLQTSIASLAQLFDQNTMISLEACAELLSREHPEKVLDPEDLKRIVEEAAQLRDDTEAADLPNDIKEFILENVDVIRAGLEDYAWFGIASVTDAAKASIGAIVLHSDKTKRLKEHSLGKRFKQLLGRLVLVLQVVDLGLQLPHDIRQDLLDFHPSAVSQAAQPGIIDVAVPGTNVAGDSTKTKT